MPRRSRHIGHRGSRPSRTPSGSVDLDPVARLRALVAEGIVAAAALKARDDLELAAASTQRLGALTSGMWRALSRELATAAERLDRSTDERLEDIERRATSLGVEAEAVVAAGISAAHFEVHRETLETVLPEDGGARRFLGPDLLFACTIDDPVLDDDDDVVVEGQDVEVEVEAEDEDGDEVGDDDDAAEPAPWSVTVWLFFWPAPLTPASVSFVPTLAATTTQPLEAAIGLTLSAPEPLLEALRKATQLSTESLQEILPTLGVACWTAHQLDELADNEEDDDEEEEEASDDVSDEEEE